MAGASALSATAGATAGAVSARAAEQQRLQRIVDAVARQEPRISWVLKYALDTPKGVQTGLLWPAIFVAAFAALGLAVALVVPATRFRPIIRLTVEWLEVLAMIALLPAAGALGGLFAWLRH